MKISSAYERAVVQKGTFKSKPNQAIELLYKNNYVEAWTNACTKVTSLGNIFITLWL